MAALVQNHEVRSERTGGFTGRREWNRIVTARNDYRGDFDPFQVTDEVKIPQTFPYGFLYPADNPEGCEVYRLVRIRKITRDPELEGALPVGLWIPLSQAGRRQLVA